MGVVSADIVTHTLQLQVNATDVDRKVRQIHFVRDAGDPWTTIRQSSLADNACTAWRKR